MEDSGSVRREAARSGMIMSGFLIIMIMSGMIDYEWVSYAGAQPVVVVLLGAIDPPMQA